MKFLHLIWASLFRKKARTILTVLSIVVAFLLFGLLQAVNEAFNAGEKNAQADRLITNSRYSIIDMLPIAFQQQIASVPGVKEVAFASWFGGSYDNRPAQFAVFPVQPEQYVKVVPELVLAPEQLEKWKNTRDGAIVGKSLAERYGWKIGDRVTLVPDIWPKADGSNWEFEVVGHFTTTDTQQNEGALLFQYDYFDEARARGKGTVGWFLLKIEDPTRADDVGKKVDALFANSPNETKTQTEKAFAQGFAKQFGDIGFIITSILGAVFFTILVLSGNTMAQAVRERIPELAILKTLGFTDRKVLGLVLSESLLMSFLGGFIGLGIAALAIGGMKAALGAIGVEALSIGVFIKAVIVMILLGVSVGLLPALRAMRLRIVDALGGHQ
jgi:putative ABC transport system permease protein